MPAWQWCTNPSDEEAHAPPRRPAGAPGEVSAGPTEKEVTMHGDFSWLDPLLWFLEHYDEVFRVLGTAVIVVVVIMLAVRNIGDS